MAKDPAQLFYYKDFLISTADWDADEKGWYISLLAHQMDKPDGLPNDVEKLAQLAGVKFSEYNRFVTCYNRTLKARFNENSQGLLLNSKLSEVQQNRSEYTEKQQLRGVLGVYMKRTRKAYAWSEAQLKEFSKEFFNALDVSMNEQEKEDCYNHLVKAYGKSILANGNANINIGKDKGGVGENEESEIDDPENENLFPTFTLSSSVDVEFLIPKVLADKDNFVRVFVQRGISSNDLEPWLNNFCIYLKFNGETKKTEKDFRRHFANWIPYQDLQNVKNYQPVKEFKNDKKYDGGVGLSARDRQTRASAELSEELRETIELAARRNAGSIG